MDHLWVRVVDDLLGRHNRLARALLQRANRAHQSPVVVAHVQPLVPHYESRDDGALRGLGAAARAALLVRFRAPMIIAAEPIVADARLRRHAPPGPGANALSRK